VGVGALDVLVQRSLAAEGAHQQVLVDAHPGEHTPTFRCLGNSKLDDQVRLHGLDLVTAEANGSLPRRRNAADRAQGGRLAGAVGADRVTISPSSTVSDTPLRAWMLP
jgi:hypothetical protein